MVTPTQIKQFVKSTGKAGEDNSQWLAYCAFHSGDYQRAKDVSTFLTNYRKVGWFSSLMIQQQQLMR